MPNRGVTYNELFSAVTAEAVDEFLAQVDTCEELFAMNDMPPRIVTILERTYGMTVRAHDMQYGWETVMTSQSINHMHCTYPNTTSMVYWLCVTFKGLEVRK